MTTPVSVMQQLADVIESRKRERPSGSYTVGLLEAGHAAMSSKLIEEAYELVAAVGEPELQERSAVVHEAADLAYHLLVLIASVDIEWRHVERELLQRFGDTSLAPSTGRPGSP